ncbi:MAG: zinc ABC transporter substrate-binding protein [Bifidobacteriaceae bacterium]|nr:zinc ABC transporter substrate-binding protein [Bifidobacteriaceae bacterium]
MTTTRHFKAIAIFATIALALAPLSACGSSSSSSSSQSSDSKIRVASSITQWGSLVNKIGGDDVASTSIVSSTGTSSHEYEPTTTDISGLTGADIAVVNGLGYDAWATDALENDTDTTVINVADLVGAKDTDNPHLWFSKDARDKTAEAVRDALEKLDPANKDTYEKNYETWNTAESDLQKNLDMLRPEVKGHTYVATEDLAYYLLNDLGMVDITPEGFKNARASESEPSAQDISEMKDIVSSKKVDVLVVNEQESDDITKELTDAATSANVSQFSLTESMPDEYGNLLDWINTLANSLMLIMPASGSSSSNSSDPSSSSASSTSSSTDASSSDSSSSSN